MYHTNEKTNTTTTTTSSSSSSTTRARAHEECLINVSVEALRDLYRDCIGSEMTPMIEKRLRQDLQEGVPFFYFDYALKEAGYAPRPSWRYTMAIVRRLQLQHVPEEELMPLPL